MTAKIGRTTVTMDVIEGSSPTDLGVYHQVPPAIWRRAARLIERFGADEALAELDRRAEECVDRQDVPSAVRWRNVMAAIHAISSEDVVKDRLN